VAKIYVIDDDDQLLRMVGLMLERGGHSVKLINNPQDGLETLKIDKPDLLVLDVMMPGMSGHDIARQIRLTPGIDDLPILVLTARSQEIDKATALQSGADDYLSKPVTSQELIERVDRLLSRHSSKQTPHGGTVIAFYGMRGGVGRTTLAVNLAAALRRVSQKEVCLVEWTPSCGQAVAHLRIQARSTWADLAALDSVQWETLKNRLVIHNTGLRLLAAPKLPESPDKLSDGLVRNVLSLLREKMLFTVVDLPPVYNPAVAATLEECDMAFQVVTPDVVSVQTAVYLTDFLQKNNKPVRQQSYVLNEVTPNPPLPLPTIERGLKSKVAFQVGFDPNQARALAQGVPLTLTPATSPIPVTMTRLAERIWKRISVTPSS